MGLFEKLKGYIGNKNLAVQAVNGEVKIICADNGDTLVTADSEWEKTKFLWHQGHNIHCVWYGKEDGIWNISIECVDCNDVLFNVDNPEGVE